MSKVYVLTKLTFDDDAGHFDNTDIIGVVSRKAVAEQYVQTRNNDFSKCMEEFELDDPELLNRIARESEMKK